MTILIISHTDHYIDANGTVVGWGPTITELDRLAECFGEVIHIACLYKNKPAPASAVAYSSNKVRFVPIKPFGGNGFLNKLNIITRAFSNLRKINRELKNADVFQFRAPTSIGVYIIPFLTFFTNKKGWYKYAGNWANPNPPLSYHIQKWMLLNLQSRKITINGRWNNQPTKCISFENPCLDEQDRIDGVKVITKRTFNKPLRLCFVGRLDKEKGIYDILDAIKTYPDPKIFSAIDIIGDGGEAASLVQYVKDLPITVNLHGAQPRNSVFEIYRQADFLLLPSESEGFPKVVAEAANFGCIPIVADVSSIGQYVVNGKNGFLWKASQHSFPDFFKAINFSDTEYLKGMPMDAHAMASSFTYSYYTDKLKEQILNDAC